MCQNADARNTMGLVGQERVKNYFEIKTVMSAYLKIYEKAVAVWQESVSN
jgi:hypothetical protein